MCGLPVSLIVFLLTVVVLAAVVFKLRGWFKRLLPLLEKLRDDGHDFILFAIICSAMVLAAVSVAGFIEEHNEQITAAFGKARESCEPPPEISLDEAIRRLTAPRQWNGADPPKVGRSGSNPLGGTISYVPPDCSSPK